MLSFWLGAAVATVFWLIINALRPIFHQMGENIRAKREAAKAKASALTIIENHYLLSVLKYAQGLHLAAPLFALDEIILPPVVLAPPPRVEPGDTSAHLDDAVSLSIPYLPAWPELACIYQTPTLTLSQALSGNSDIVLTGQPGAGKTVALAYLASRLARRNPEPGLPPDTVPLLVHVADIELPLKKDDPLTPLIDHIVAHATKYDPTRIPEFVRNVFTAGRALLLIDGTDELTPMGLGEVTKYIRTLKRAYPKTRIITTANPDYLDGLVTLNFIPFVLAAWGTDKRNAFYDKWGDLWNNFVAKETWAQTLPDQIDPILLNRWLAADTTILTPLELTLKAWSAYAGDARGPRTIDSIESHLRRVTPAGAPREALDMLALQVHLATEPVFDPRKARGWIKSFEPPEETPAPETEEETEPKKGKKKSGKPEKLVAPSLGLISKLAESGLLAQHRGNKMRFLHPVFGGYLAGNILGSYKPEAVIDQPPWSGKMLSMHYFAARGDASNMVNLMLSRTDRPFERNLLTPARWLRDAPKNMPWRGKVMARLAELLQQNGLPIGLRGQALAAFIAADDPAVGSLFRQLFRDPSAELLQLCALGSGAIRDAKAIEDLGGLVNHPSPNVGRAACLALVKIGTTAAIDVVAGCLLHGAESLPRRGRSPGRPSC